MTRTTRTQRLTQEGFSLLEVMVAVALLSLGLVLLLQVQARSIQLAQQGRDITIATMLARAKLMDCQTDLLKKGFSVGDYESDGKFDDEGYPQIYWECHAYKPDMPTADGGDMSGLASLAGGSSSSPGPPRVLARKPWIASCARDTRCTPRHAASTPWPIWQVEGRMSFTST